MKRINVSLPANRWHMGQMCIEDEDGVVCFGPVVVDGKSDDSSALSHNNQTRNPEKAFGDTPAGEYVGRIGFEEDNAVNRRSFGDPNASGKIPIIRLQPIEGDSQAWRRQLSEGIGVDMGLAIHAGALNGTGGLRATHGCVRALQGDIPVTISILEGYPSFPVSITEK